MCDTRPEEIDFAYRMVYVTGELAHRVAHFNNEQNGQKGQEALHAIHFRQSHAACGGTEEAAATSDRGAERGRSTSQARRLSSFGHDLCQLLEAPGE